MMRSRAALAAGCILGVVAIFGVWEVAASALYCAIIGQPAAFAAVAAIIYRCLAGRRGRQALYGSTPWAGDSEMRRGGIIRHRRPFS